ncbi:MAG: hypothetical protein D6772_05455 [Bacteroidetes bacterium]|nr:MAG: hypothetical protein D6772_05455 [Bacteroidota bacterium]
MRPFPFLLLVLAACTLTFQSCVSADKLVESGRYEEAILLAQRKLAGKQRKSPKMVRAAEEAFARYQARQLREIDRLKRANRPENWGRINELYRDLRRYQNALEPLLPLVDKNGYVATFSFVDTRQGEHESREKAAAFHYDEGNNFMLAARRGDKRAARLAYQEYEQARRYFRNYRDTHTLMQEAHQLGINHVLISVQNDAPVVTPRDFDRRLRQLNFGNRNTFWQQYHVDNNPRIDFDFQINLRITDIAVSPERVSERQYVDRKEIQDGFDYVLDQNGNVMKDSLGNDIKVERYVTVEAYVTEVLQQKEAIVSGEVEVISLATGRLIRRQPLTARARFENYASTFIGDERALSPDTRCRIGNAPRPFPPNEVLILQAAEELKPALMTRIDEYRDLVQV